MKNKEIRSTRDYINSLLEPVYNCYGRKLAPTLLWVDKLPEERQLWADPEPEGYTGYRLMSQSAHIERLNSFVAVERTTYNTGAAGYSFYNYNVYVRKDIWQNFHLDPFEVSKRASLKAGLFRRFAACCGGYKTIFDSLEECQKWVNSFKERNPQSQIPVKILVV